MRAWRAVRARLAWACSSLCLCTAAQAAMPTFAEVRADYRPSDVQILDRQGQVIQTVRLDRQVRRLPWVRLQDISPAMRTAIVLSEDQRFWRHSGVDWQAVAAGAWTNLWNHKTRGASTVTMQLAGLLAEGQGRPKGGRSWGQKVSQAWMAHQLESNWSKSEILEAYLNLVPFRGEMVGLSALTQTLFGKHPDGLDAQESAVAAALVRGPNAPAPTVTRRACQVLTWQRLSCAGLDALTGTALMRKGGPPLGEQLAPHFGRLLVQQFAAHRPATPVPLSVRTTLDARWQRLATTLLRQHLSELNGRDVEDGAVIVLDNARGDVLAWVGSSGSLSDTPQVDAVLARRQPGSTLKPFVYGLAFERKLLTPASLLHDAPVQLPTGAGLYIPQNYDKQFKGWVSVRTALGNSLNVPAVRAGAMLGPDALAGLLNRAGLGLREPGGFYGPGLALGSPEVTLRDLTNAYRALANQGVWTTIRTQPGDAQPEAPRRFFSAATAYLLSDILSDNTARALTFGLDSALATRGFAAVKTGTSKDMRDNWCVGYTSRYTVGVWVGNTSGSPMHDVSGVSGAAPVWAALVRELHRAQPSLAPRMPAGVVRQAIHFERQGRDPVDADRDEVFMAGTAMSLWHLAASGTEAERAIQSPQDGAIYALDPDMPPRNQRIALRSRQSVGEWWLDGHRLSSRADLWWQPWPGRHELIWRRKGQDIDKVRFEVRGAGVKPPTQLKATQKSRP